MGTNIRIALDAMSGDRGPQVVADAAIAVAAAREDVGFVLVGREQELAGLVPASGAAAGRIDVRHAPEVVAMDEPPADALRKKKHSSMRVAIDMVKSGEASACVSAGNTGALMATARFVLKTIAGIDRPAIIADMPARGGSVHMLDLGANADCSVEQLFQFAVMGAVVTADMRELEAPRVALLNIGEEDMKGNEMVRDAAARLGASRLNYVGFVEGNDIFSGKADVVVTDGFSGNIALKTMEGTAGLIAYYLRESFNRNLWTKLQGLAARGVLRSLRARLDPRHYNGASLVGLNGIVIKSHGSADSLAFQHAIETALVEVRFGVPVQIGQMLEREAA